MLRTFSAFILSLALGSAAFAQSTAINGTIEGTVKDDQGALLPGGNGIAFDWRLLDGVKDKVAFMLSGGLDAKNVAQAIRVTGANTVDVSSGVERAPGDKDPDRIRAFIAAVHASPPPGFRPAGPHHRP